MADSEEGADQVEVEVMDEVAGEEEEAEEGGNMGMIIGIVGVLLVVVVAGIGLACYFMSSGSGTCKKDQDECTKTDLAKQDEEPAKSMDEKLKGDEFCAKLSDAQCVAATFANEKKCCTKGGDAPAATAGGT
jgi:hypothetical protein